MKRDHGGASDARIDASVNLNPLGPPTELDAVFARARELARRYPQIEAADARDAWAACRSIDAARVAVGNGASELISVAIRAIAPRRVVVFDPCYSEYAAAAAAASVPVAHVSLALDGARWRTPIEQADAGEGDLVIVCQPNNPTGHATDPEGLLSLAEQGAHVLVDESFLALSEDSSRSLVPHVGERITVIESLTKTFCVPGLRLGLLFGDPALVSRIAELRDPWSVNGIAAEAAVVLANAREYLARSRVLVETERRRMAAGFSAIEGVRVSESVAPFLLLRLPKGRTAPELCGRLLRRGIAIRDASTFTGLDDRWVRVGIRMPHENSEVLDAIAEELA